MYIFFPFLFLLLLLNLQSPVYASIGKSRKHSTAHYFTNGTLIVLGGTVTDLNTTETQFAPPILSLFFNPEDLSLTSSTLDTSPLLQPMSGHTSHYNSSSGSLFSVFGIYPNGHYSPPMQSHFKLLSPSAYHDQEEKRQNEIGRQHHSSSYVNSTLYIFGGYYIRNGKKQLENDSLIIHENKTARAISFPSIYGHSTIQYQQWLISCFGHQEQSFNRHCIWFDTTSLSVSNIIVTSPEGPAARTYASMVSIKDGHYILYGGETGENEVLDDVWELIILQPFEMTWKKLGGNSKGKKRSGHVGIPLSNEIILYFGGISRVEEEDVSHLFNITNMEWIETPDKSNQLLIKRAEESSSTSSASLNGGGIAGIVIGILILLGVIYLLWRRIGKKKIRAPSRATRFQPQIPLQRPAVNETAPPLEEHQPQQQQQQQQQQPFVLSLPEIALSSNSRLSLGPNFGYLPGSNKSETSLESISESKSRTSSVFPARKSYLYPPPTPRTPDSTFSNSVRASVSAKSVSSVQWVGFNDNMDYSSNDVHLSIANRASNYYSDTSAQTTPQTPMFPNYLKDNYEKNIPRNHFDK
jgi:hypothetical protein